MQSFKPVHFSAACRLSLSFGDEARPGSTLLPDVLETLINRFAVNALVQATGCSSVLKLDELLWSKRLEKAPHLAHADPTRYFTKLARGSPQLRSRGPVGRPVKNLYDYLTLFDDAALEFWIAARWSFWDLIHPDPMGVSDLLFIRTRMPGAGNEFEGHRLATIRCPEQQSVELLAAMKEEHPAEGVNALWHALRQTIVDGDLVRYAYLYHTWLSCRPVLEKSMLFRRLVEKLYDFTAVWFGQVEIALEPTVSPITDREEYFRLVRRAIGQLRPMSKDKWEARKLWAPFRFNKSAEHDGMIVRPRSDVHAFHGLGENLRPSILELRFLELKAKPLPTPPRRSPYDNGATVTDTV